MVNQFIGDAKVLPIPQSKFFHANAKMYVASSLHRVTQISYLPMEYDRGSGLTAGKKQNSLPIVLDLFLYQRPLLSPLRVQRHRSNQTTSLLDRLLRSSVVMVSQSYRWYRDENFVLSALGLSLPVGSAPCRIKRARARVLGRLIWDNSTRHGAHERTLLDNSTPICRYV